MSASSAPTNNNTETIVDKISKTLFRPASLVLLSFAAVGAGYYVYKAISKTRSSSKSATGDDYSDASSTDDSNSESEEVELKGFTLEDLHNFDGVKNQKIYVSVKGKVYDVTGSGFYGKNETYAAYAGHEVSKALALNDTTSQYLDQVDMSDLKKEELDHLNGMVEHFEMKYMMVGWLEEWTN